MSSISNSENYEDYFAVFGWRIDCGQAVIAYDDNSAEVFSIRYPVVCSDFSEGSGKISFCDTEKIFKSRADAGIIVGLMKSSFKSGYVKAKEDLSNWLKG